MVATTEEAKTDNPTEAAGIGAHRGNYASFADTSQ